jgi:hypothetical protein
MGLRSLLSPSVDMKVSLTEFWWLVGLVFVGTFVLTILNKYMNTIPTETTIIQVQTPRYKTVSESPYTSSIVINITHRQAHTMPELWLPPSAVPEETKKTL